MPFEVGKNYRYIGSSLDTIFVFKTKDASLDAPRINWNEYAPPLSGKENFLVVAAGTRHLKQEEKDDLEIFKILSPHTLGWIEVPREHQDKYFEEITPEIASKELLQKEE